MFQVRQSSSLDTGQFYWNFEGNTIDPGPLAGDPGLYLVANPNDLIIEDSGLGFFFSYYVYVVLGIAIIAAAVSPLHVSIVSIGLQTCLLFTAICSALIKIGYTEGISIALGSLVAAGLACFLVSRLEESQQFKAAQISTFISMAISLVTVSYCDLACLLVIGGIQWMVYNKKVSSPTYMSPEDRSRFQLVFGLNLMFITYWLMCLIMFSRTPITAITRAYRGPFSMYPAGLFSLFVSFICLCLFRCLNCLLNRKSTLDKIAPQLTADVNGFNQDLTSYNYH